GARVAGAAGGGAAVPPLLLQPGRGEGRAQYHDRLAARARHGRRGRGELRAAQPARRWAGGAAGDGGGGDARLATAGRPLAARALSPVDGTLTRGEEGTIMPTAAAVTGFLEQFAPPSLAAQWDNVGLLLGDRQARVKRVMTCLTVTPESAAEAVEAKAQLIVTHHPILFRPVKRLTTGNPEGRMLLSLARAGVAVFSPHTAFDNTRGGINDAIAAKIGLIDVAPLRRGEGPRSCKVVVFVPDKDLARVSDAMFDAGAGHIGEYSQCSFRLAGTGTFFGSDASNPTIGQ